MVSPARRHRQKMLAAAAGSRVIGARTAASAMPETGAVATEYQLLLAALGIDLASLREIQSTERKIEAKATMIERYRIWVEAAADSWIAGDIPSLQDDIVSTMAVWSIDVQDWPLATKLARYVILGRIDLPKRYERTAPTLIAEEIAEAAMADPAVVPFEVLAEVADLVREQDIFDQVRAKLEKALGLSFQLRAANFDTTEASAVAGGKGALLSAAIGHFQRALQLHAKCSVKTLIRDCERDLKALSAASESPPSDDIAE